MNRCHHSNTAHWKGGKTNSQVDIIVQSVRHMKSYEEMILTRSPKHWSSPGFCLVWLTLYTRCPPSEIVLISKLQSTIIIMIHYLKMPPNDNIGSALAMLGRNFCNVWVLQHLKCKCEKSEICKTFDSLLIIIIIITSWPVLGSPEVMEPWRAQGRSADPRAE